MMLLKHIFVLVILIILTIPAIGLAGNSPDMERIRNFEFQKNNCPGSDFTLPAHLDSNDVQRLNRMFAQRKNCEDQLMHDDRVKLSQLIISLGGQVEVDDQDFTWQIPWECDCKPQISNLVSELQRRDNRRIMKYKTDSYQVAQKVRSQRY